MTEKRVIRAAALLLFIAICTGTVWAQDSYWEGKVSAAPYGLLPHNGMYAASNAFPLDSKVEITHPSNGSTVEVRVVERVDTDRMFMQVSREAAQELGITEDEVFTAKVSPLRSEDDIIEPMISQDRPYTADPDVNPSAEVEGDGLSMVEQYLSERGQGRIEPEPAGEPQPVTEEAARSGETAAAAETKPAETKPAETKPAETEPARASVPQADTLPDRVQPRSQITVELPEPGLAPARTVEAAPAEESEEAEETEEREAEESAAAARETRGPTAAELEPLFVQEKDQRYSPDAPELPETGEEREGPEPSLASADPGTEGVDTAEIRISHVPAPPAADVPSADIAPAVAVAEPDETEADEVSHMPVLPEEKPAEIPEDADLVLVPAEERPPEGPPTVPEQEQPEQKQPEEEQPEEETESVPALERRPAEVVRTPGGEIPVQQRIDTGSYYLQVAAYSKLDLAQARGKELSVQYPVTLYREDGGVKAPYKLMIGPLNEDESGTLLFTFTSRGYRDAFIRKGN